MNKPKPYDFEKGLVDADASCTAGAVTVWHKTCFNRGQLYFANIATEI